jgi:hypothetical protein
LESAVTGPADRWPDDTDRAILDRLAAVQARLDPPPADLDARTTFAIALEEIDLQVARRGEDLLVGSGARALETARTVTFDADSRTIMVSIADRADGLVRLDGWLAPAARLAVVLRLAGTVDTPARSQTVISNEAGRFVFDRVPHGLAQLLVRPLDDGGAPEDAAVGIVTPSLVL